MHVFSGLACAEVDAELGSTARTVNRELSKVGAVDAALGTAAGGRCAVGDEAVLKTVADGGGKALRELSTDAPITELIGPSEAGAFDGLRQPHAIDIGGLCAQVQLDIRKALPIRELRERHDAKLLGAREILYVMITVATGNDAVKALPRQEVHDLYEDSLAEVHALLQA